MFRLLFIFFTQHIIGRIWCLLFPHDHDLSVLKIIPRQTSVFLKYYNLIVIVICHGGSHIEHTTNDHLLTCHYISLLFVFCKMPYVRFLLINPKYGMYASDWEYKLCSTDNFIIFSWFSHTKTWCILLSEII